MNGRRARQIRQQAQAAYATQSDPDRQYAPQVLHGPHGQVRAVFAERRLIDGPRALARQLRKQAHRYRAGRR